MTSKIYTILLLTILYSILYSQTIHKTDTLITQLTGIEDAQGNTHLFYQIQQKNFYENSDTIFLHYYHFDVVNKSEHKQFNSFIANNYNISESDYKKLIVDFSFLNNDLQKSIVLYNSFSKDTSAVIIQFNNKKYEIDKGNAKFLQVINDTIWVNIDNKIYFSGDYGTNWELLPYQTDNFLPLSISPFNANILFCCKDGRLYKTINGGKSFELVHDDDYWYDNSKLFYDKDKRHIYAMTVNYGHKDLLISDNNGEVNSWSAVKKFLSINSVLAVDDSISGLIYYTFGNQIYYSSDYGKSFKVLIELPHKITGLYKKPNSNILYCSTKNKIYEIIHDGNNLISQKIIKSILPKESLKFYPLTVGNKWVYNTTGWWADLYLHYIDEIKTIEVVGDTVINDSIYCFKIVENNNTYFQNIDSTNGKVFKFYYQNGEVYYYYDIDLLAINNDHTSIGIVENVVDTVKFIFGKNRLLRKFEYLSLDIFLQEYVEGIGLYVQEESFDFGYAKMTLKGCIINGILYGDTTTVDVKNDIQKIPEDFILFQNYPNPFNFATIIKFAIPKREKVTLKIFDVLGREVATLIDGEFEAGYFEVRWDANNFSNGIYFYRLSAGSFAVTKKMILLK